MYPPFGPYVFNTPIRWYGVILMSAALIGAIVAGRYMRGKGFNPEIVWDLLKWVLIPAILGARLYFVFIQTPWNGGPDGVVQRYLQHPLEIFAVWHGGIHIYGALIFGAAAAALFARHRRLPLPLLLDAAALVLPLSQAIGRWANFINQELYGPPPTLPWGLRIDPDHRIPPYDNLALYPTTTRFQPLFLYEMIGNLIGFGIIFWISRRFASKLKPGDIILMYLIEYPGLRFFMEFFRTDSWFFQIGGLHFNLLHIMSLAAAAAAGLALYLRHRPSSTQSAGLARLGERLAAVLAALERGWAPVMARLDQWFAFLRPMPEDLAAKLNAAPAPLTASAPAPALALASALGTAGLRPAARTAPNSTASQAPGSASSPTSKSAPKSIPTTTTPRTDTRPRTLAAVANAAKKREANSGGAAQSRPAVTRGPNHSPARPKPKSSAAPPRIKSKKVSR